MPSARHDFPAERRERSARSDDPGHLEVHRVGVAPVAAPGEAPLLEDGDHDAVHLTDRPAQVARHVEVQGGAEGVVGQARGAGDEAGVVATGVLVPLDLVGEAGGDDLLDPGIAGQAEDGATRLRVPVRRAQAGERRHQIDAAGIAGGLGESLAVARMADQLDAIAQPLHDCAGNEDRSFQCIGRFAVQALSNGCQELVL